MIPKEEKKRDLSKPKKINVPARETAAQKKKAEAPPMLSLEKLWQEIQRLKNGKVEYGEFYKLQRRLGVTGEKDDSSVVGKVKDKDKMNSQKRNLVEKTGSASKLPDILEMVAQATAA